MMSDIDNLDIMLGNSGENPVERELADAIEQSSVQGYYEASEYRRNNYSFTQENEPIRQNEVRQNLLSLLRTSSISDCPKKWIP